MEITTEHKSKAEEIAEVIVQLHRTFLVDVTTEAGKGNISIQQYMLLGFLVHAQGITMSRLAQMMQHTTPATTGLVDRLVEAGLVVRFGVEDMKNNQQELWESLGKPIDNRQKWVMITSKGRSLIGGVKQNVVNRVLAIARELTAEDFEAWLRVYSIIQARFLPPKIVT